MYTTYGERRAQGPGERGSAAFVSWLHLPRRTRSRAGSPEMPEGSGREEVEAVRGDVVFTMFTSSELEV
jgi:hypothetical protein